VSRALSLLRRNYDRGVINQLETLLADPHPALADLRSVALEELLLAGRPDIGRLVDQYRQTVRLVHLSGPNRRREPPAWTQVGPALVHFFGDLLPHTIEAQPRLRRMLPDGAMREELDRIRVAIAPPAAPLLDRLVGQASRTDAGGRERRTSGTRPANSRVRRRPLRR
jgi:hypothetical protein